MAGPGRFAGLSKVQGRSLSEEVERGQDAFQPLVRQTVPSSIYRPTLAMNAAQAWHVAQLTSYGSHFRRKRSRRRWRGPWRAVA